MTTWNPFRADIWAASNATPKRRLLGWAVLVALLGSGFIGNWFGLGVGVVVLIAYFVIANQWANLDARNAEDDSDTH